MSRELRAAHGWPWHWLQETRQTPPNVQVPPSVQPTIDVGGEWPLKQIYHSDTNVTIAGSVANVLPDPGEGLTRIWDYLNVSYTAVANVSHLILYLESTTTTPQIELVNCRPAGFGATADGRAIPLVGTYLGFLTGAIPAVPQRGLPMAILPSGDWRFRIVHVAALPATNVVIRGMYRDVPRFAPALPLYT